MKMKKIKKKPKFIFVTGGIVSGIGKGISVASLALLLKLRGYRVFPVKIDPYLNKDAGTMNPYQHGEVFVTEDGKETDLDLGHYERFIGINLNAQANFTSGAVYEKVINLEREGNFLGRTIQIIPHITDEIKKRIFEAYKKSKAEIVLVEIGGTVGDIEAEPFIEAARQMRRDYGRGNVIFVHLVKIDYIFPSDEAKTKPIQQSVALLRQRGIQPDLLIVRCKRPILKELIEKISLFTNVSNENVIEALDVKDCLYEVPVNFFKARLDILVLKLLGLKIKKSSFKNLWLRKILKIKKAKRSVKIGLVGKYIEHADAYLSVKEAVFHSGVYLDIKPEIVFVNAEDKDLISYLKGVDGLIVPGGFGKRGVEGKMKAIEYARLNRLPFLGLCLGLQLAVVEFSRNVCGLKKAMSTEFDSKTKFPVIDYLPTQKEIKKLGGSMRLGAYEIFVKEKTLAFKLYKKQKVLERHRHRFEVNPLFHKILQKNGLVFSGLASFNKDLVEIVELSQHQHPFFLATQAHPEFKSKFLKPHPLFNGFVRAAFFKK